MIELNKIYCESNLETLARMEDESIDCCVTSPPYYGLRDYGVDGQIGLEETPQEFVAKLVDVFTEVRRALKKDGTCWINLGDSYFSSQNSNRNGATGSMGGKTRGGGEYKTQKRNSGDWNLKQKDLCGMPWRVALALQDAGWWLRQDIIWAKPNPMPESVTDRCTKAHEYLFLLTKSPRYFYNADAIREPLAAKTLTTFGANSKPSGNDALGGVKSDNWHSTVSVRRPRLRGHARPHTGFNGKWDLMTKEEQQFAGANKRSVWTIATEAYPEAHFATYPEKLIEPCILAGSREDGIIYDPFFGSGTTGVVAYKLGRTFIGSEINPEYVELANKRLKPYLAQANLFATETPTQ